MYWESYSHNKINKIITETLSKNLNYKDKDILGIPATYLDELEFYDDAPWLEKAPFIKTLVANPNHIGCHTASGKHLDIFKGTQELEVDLIKICAEEIFKGEKDKQDGYVASGGTEANIQALWIYRNLYKSKFNAKHEEIRFVYSEDSHYSMPKGSNLLNVDSVVMKVNENNRSILLDELWTQLKKEIELGVKYFAVVLNMSSTMFGSVDNIEEVVKGLKDLKVEYKIHLDGAFGGFIYPFTNEKSKMNFANQEVSSITIDGYKMLQSPYGTGMFLCRKGLMDNVLTKEAQYVPGLDNTLIGSRSGANAISVWQILRRYGSAGWKAKMIELSNRTTDICDELDDLSVEYYRNPYINIIAIKATYISTELASKYQLVADSYEAEPKWWKIVVMKHVKQGTVDRFLEELKQEVLNPV